jgi:hypothetical protein
MEFKTLACPDTRKTNATCVQPSLECSLMEQEEIEVEDPEAAHLLPTAASLILGSGAPAGEWFLNGQALQRKGHRQLGNSFKKGGV